MKKYIIGGLVGFVLATAAGANAQGVTNLIDQVVQGVFPVTVQGTSIGEAVVIDNKTYLPVREFGEAVGYTVTFTEAREVVMTKNVETTEPVVTPQPTPVTGKTVAEQISDLQKKIDDVKLSLKTSKQLKKVNEDSLIDPNVPKDEVKKIIDELSAGIADNEKLIADYESQIAALQK